jgi:hypothetical protein
MKRAMIISVFVVGSLFLTAGSFAMVARGQAHAYRTTPAYCYNCHSWAPGVAYSRCLHFEFRFAHGGYYYRPLGHGHQEFRFARFNGSDHNKEYRTNIKYEPEKGIRARR